MFCLRRIAENATSVVFTSHVVYIKKDIILYGERMKHILIYAQIFVYELWKRNFDFMSAALFDSHAKYNFPNGDAGPNNTGGVVKKYLNNTRRETTLPWLVVWRKYSN